MSPTVCSPTGEIVQLNPRAFAQGGEAAVHEVQQFPGVIVKLYHPRVRAERGDTLRKKIDAMSSDPRLAGGRDRLALRDWRRKTPRAAAL